MNINIVDPISLEEDWDSIRFRLIRSSYVVGRVAKAIRDKYTVSLDKDGSTNWEDLIFTKYFEKFTPYLHKFNYFKNNIDDMSANAVHERGMRAIMAMRDFERREIPELTKLATELRINEGYLQVFVFYNNRTKKVSGPLSVESYFEGEIIRRPGRYIRLDDITSYDELKKLYEKNKFTLEVGGISENPQKISSYKKIGKKVISPEDDWKINVYMLLQEKLSYVGDICNRNELMRKYDGKLPRLLEMAINEAVDDITSKMDVAEEMEEYAANISKSKIRNAYKDVVTRYKLPNLVDVKRLVRLIGC